MSLLMIGCGKMGGALINRWTLKLSHQVTIVDPALTQAPAKTKLVTNIKDLGNEQFDMIVISIKPQLIPDILPAYVPHLANGGCFVSMAAGYSVASIEKIVGPKPVIRIMPNLPAQVGRGVSAVFPNAHSTPEHTALVTALTDAAGHTLVVDDENAIDRVTAVAGSGPGYAFEIARSWMQSAQTLGFSSEESRLLVLNTLLGSMEMALQVDASMVDLRDSVTSKNGTTEAGLNVLTRDDLLQSLFDDTLKAAYDRAVELR
ncbi:MAG: pyrroline-5-carboxylate reductase [Candidatus Azotimanducaceae bacterium]|jgi:pyrroline-5-carboxylate reductase